MFKDSKVFINPKYVLLCKAGYQGITKIPPNSETQIKKKKNKRHIIKEISKDRIYIAHHIEGVKSFGLRKKHIEGSTRTTVKHGILLLPLLT